MHEGAEMRAPGFYRFVLKYITPLFLIGIFVMWLLRNVAGWNFSFSAPTFQPSGYITDLIGATPSPVARLTVGLIALTTLFALILTHLAGNRWNAARAARRNRNS
jgi:hypothetical protein